MSIEVAAVHFEEKSWGRTDLLPWSAHHGCGAVIGEMSFHSADHLTDKPALLFKILFTRTALSIQVHPDDHFAQRIGMQNGKAEAWYILSADTGARVALGLVHPLSRADLRKAIIDGSIETLVKWRTVHAGDIISVPPGTIHAIGPGIVIAEIQQNSDLTFRLFDYGSTRQLHIDQAMAVADTEIYKPAPIPERISQERTVLVITEHFVLERLQIAPHEARAFRADQESWILGLAGQATMDDLETSQGKALLLNRTTSALISGAAGLTALVAYAAPFTIPDLLRPLHGNAERSMPKTAKEVCCHE